MPFEPGNTAHQKADRKKPRVIAQQITAALNEAADEGPTKLRMVVNALIKRAMDGDVQAINAIMDRVDGKVPQPVVGDDEEAPVRVALIERIIVDPRTPSNPDS